MSSSLLGRAAGKLRYLRLNVFVATREPFQRVMRARRMATFAERIALEAGARILDLGGTPETWDGIKPKLRVTLLNLPGGSNPPNSTHHDMQLVTGDATGTQLPDRSFDTVFSNSVIEHVGDAAKRAAFAREARRLGRSYWVQTPSKWFPIEAHTGIPLWWQIGEPMRRLIIARWRKKLPAWTEMVEGTTVVTKAELRSLFPDAEIITERFLGLPKSYIAVRPSPGPSKREEVGGSKQKSRARR
jgi:hypothetical protein